MPPRSKPARKTRPRLVRVEVVVNTASGSVGADAPDELAEIFEAFGVGANICAPEALGLTDCLRDAIARKPDLLVVLAGDGTARAAAELSGPKGPPIAPLAGGTMNMLPHAVYGARPWQEALRQTLECGEERMLGGGEVEGHRFLCGAILGSPALWAPAREAVREGQLRLAVKQARRALGRAFTGRLRYALDKEPRAKAEAMILMCPVASKAMDETEPALEAAAIDVRNAGQALRLGLNAVVRDWRVDPAVESQPARVVRLWSARSIPAVLDGETVRLKAVTEVRFTPAVCRVFAPPAEGLA